MFYQYNRSYITYNLSLGVNYLIMQAYAQY